MVLEAASLRETCAALPTLVRALPRVHAHVLLEVITSREGLAALLAAVTLFFFTPAATTTLRLAAAPPRAGSASSAALLRHSARAPAAAPAPAFRQ